MKKLLLLMLVACSSKDTPKQSEAATKTEPAADPWLEANKDKAPKLAPDLEKLKELAVNGPGKMMYPQADSIVALEEDHITLAPDGTVTERFHSIVKILDEQRGKEKYADLHVPFDRKRQTLTIDLARTVGADGVPHIANADEIGDIVPPALADATMYSDVRERVVSFPAVEKGSVLELQWTRVTKLGPDSAQGGERLLAQWNPVLSRTVTITVPSTVTPKIVMDRSDLKPVVTKSGANTVYTISTKNLPDQQPEMAQLDDSAVLPRVVFGFHADWNAALKPVADRFFAIGVPEKLPPTVVEKAQAIVANAKTDAEKARALFQFVSREIRGIDIELGVAGYEPHAPETVLANGYGDDRDKVGLLLALASAVKLSGRPVFVRTGHVPVLADVPTLAQFDKVLATISIDGKDIWLQPTNEHARYGVAFAGQDNLVLPLTRGGGRAELGRRPLLEPSTSLSHITATYALSPSGDLDAKFKYSLTGAFAEQASQTLRPLKGENFEQWFQGQAGNAGAGAIDKRHAVTALEGIEGAIEVAHDVSVPGYTQTQGTFRVLELPSPTLDLATEIPSTGTSTRKYPMYLGTPKTHVADVSIAVPAGWKVAYVPPALESSAEGLAYKEGCTATGQTITCRAELAVSKVSLPADKYIAFHEAMSKRRAYERRIVLLTKG